LTALQRALEIEDEPSRAWRGVPLAIGGAVVCIVAGVVAARTFALGGWPSPLLPIGLLVAVPAMVAAWSLAGNHERRLVITAVAMVAGLVTIPIASSGATPSTGRLVEFANHLSLPGTVVREVRIGSGRCRPACSELRRTSVMDGISFVKVVSQHRIALASRGFTVKEYAHAVGEPTRIDGVRGKIAVSLELRRIDEVRTRIASVFLAEGPTPDTSVG
jgi:hypothetical protein